MSGARLEVHHVTHQCHVRADRRDVVRGGSAGVFFLWRNRCGAEMSAKSRVSPVSPSRVGERRCSPLQPTEPRPSGTSVRVVAHIWGLTTDDQDFAEREARWGWSRRTWDFVAIGRSAGETCSLNLLDGKSLAAASGRSWAYVVYPARRVINLAVTYREMRDLLVSLGVPTSVGASDA